MLNPVLSRLPILILSPHSRCNCRCVMCDIWKVTDAREISADELERHAASIEGMGVEWAVFTGGEPLMHSDLFRLCLHFARARHNGLTVLSTGLLLEKHAEAIVANVDDVIVSLDGPADVHDRIRRVPGACEKLSRGVMTIRSIREDFPINGRCTVQRLNHAQLPAVVAAAHAIDLTGISFLAADLTSEAFNRTGASLMDRQSRTSLTAEQLPALEAGIELVIRTGECGGFVAESPEKLRKIGRHFRAHLGYAEAVAPVCNAPWVSVFVDADGVVRPCFFHPPIGKVDAATSLGDVVNDRAAVAFRASTSTWRPIQRAGGAFVRSTGRSQ